MAEYCKIYISKYYINTAGSFSGGCDIDLPSEATYRVGETIECSISNIKDGYLFAGAFTLDKIVGIQDYTNNKFIFVVPDAESSNIRIFLTDTDTKSHTSSAIYKDDGNNVTIDSIYVNGVKQELTTKYSGSYGDLITINGSVETVDYTIYELGINAQWIEYLVPPLIYSMLYSTMDLYEIIDDYHASFSYTFRLCRTAYNRALNFTKNIDGGRIHMPDKNLIFFQNKSNVRTIFTPSRAEIEDLGNYLYNGNFINTIKSVTDQIGSVGGSVSDYLIRLIMLPVTIERGEQYYMRVGIYKDAGVPLSLPADVDSPKRTVNLGTITFEGLNGNYLDYRGNYQLFLPFYGIVDLSPADVVDKTIGIKYIINIEDGNSLIHITINNTVKYVFSCNVGYNIPIGSSNLSDNLTNAIKDLGMAGIMMGV